MTVASPRKTEERKPDPALEKAIRQHHNFWCWLVTPESERGGLERWLNRFLLMHAAIGLSLAFAFNGDLAERARSVILPMAGVLVGLTFAWSATAISIITSKEFRRLMETSKQGIRGTANYFQLAILTVLGSTVLWALAGLGPYSHPTWLRAATGTMLAASFLFAFSSFAITECWSAINQTRLALLGYNLVKEFEERESQDQQKT